MNNSFQTVVLLLNLEQASFMVPQIPLLNVCVRNLKEVKGTCSATPHFHWAQKISAHYRPEPLSYHMYHV
jgi:hypothetical protein